jgi:hypothetical protein
MREESEVVVYSGPLVTVFLKYMSKIPYQCNLKIQTPLKILECVNIFTTFKKITTIVSTSLEKSGCSVDLKFA